MALKLARVGGEKKKVVEPPDTDMGMPTTLVKMGTKAATRYDPLATVSIMDQLKTSAAPASKTRRLPMIGHLPAAKQIQVLGLMFIAFLALAVLMLFLDGRTAAQQAASFATAMDMQMLSQRVARSSALATQGQAGALQAAKDSRDRFGEDLNALLNGGTVHGASLGGVTDPAQTDILNAIKARWERVGGNLDHVFGSEAALAAVARGNESVTEGTKGFAELAQQAGQQILQAGGTSKDVEQAAQLGAVAQRIARNTGTLMAADDVDADLSAALARDNAALKETLASLSRTADGLKQQGAATTRGRRSPSLRSVRRRSTPASRRSRRTPRRSAPRSTRRGRSMPRASRSTPTRRSSSANSRAAARRTSSRSGRRSSSARSRSHASCCSASWRVKMRAAAHPRAKARTSATRKRFSGS